MCVDYVNKIFDLLINKSFLGFVAKTRLQFDKIFLFLFTIGGLTGVILGTPAQSGDFPLQVEAADQTNSRIQKNLNVRINSSPLQITTFSLPDAHVAIEYFQQLQAQGGNPPYHWQLQSGQLPVGISLSPAGVLFGTPQNTAVESFTMLVTDSQEHSDSEPYTLVVNTETLTVLTDILPTARLTQNYQHQLQAQGGVPPYTWIITSGNLPRNLIFVPDGTLSGAPEQTGIFPFNVQVTDAQNHLGTKMLHLDVIERDLTITTTAFPDATVGVPYNLQVNAEGGISPYEWSIVSGGLPNGLLLDSNSGIISGTSAQAGNFPISLMVTDTLNNEYPRAFTLRVLGAPLLLTTVALSGAQVAVPYQDTLTAQGGTPPYIWTIIPGNLPIGLGLDANRGIISGTPTLVQTAAFTVRVEDQEQNQDVKLLSIRVDPQPLTITTQSLPNGEVGINYNFLLAASGGNPPYAWQITQGQLPAGLLFDGQTAAISGTPTAAVTNLALTFRATDAANNFTTRNLNLTIDPAGLGPVTGFIAQASNQKAGLAWVNPSSPQFHHALIVRNTTGFPQTPNDGTVVYSGTGNNMVDANLANDSTVYYRAFAYDQANNVVPPGTSGQGLAAPHAVTLSGPNDPFADEVMSFTPLNPGNCFGLANMPNVVLGPPRGAGEYAGSLDVVSFHAKVNNDSGAAAPYGGSVVLKFNNNIVVNGPGVDFTIFENALHAFSTTNYFIEPAVVDVSYDGVNFYRFPFDFVPHYTPQNQLDLQNPFAYPTGFAGVKPVLSNNLVPDPTDPAVSGGDSFDLNNISPNLTWIQYVRITSTGDNWLQDMNGDFVRHTHGSPTWGASGTGNSGFDLDAVAAVNY